MLKFDNICKNFIVYYKKWEIFMEKTNKSGLAIAGLVLGIVGVCTSFIPIVNNISFIMGILGAIFGIISLVKKNRKR